jgi:hypothetical protein
MQPQRDRHDTLRWLISISLDREDSQEAVDRPERIRARELVTNALKVFART